MLYHFSNYRLPHHQSICSMCLRFVSYFEIKLLSFSVEIVAQPLNSCWTICACAMFSSIQFHPLNIPTSQLIFGCFSVSSISFSFIYQLWLFVVNSSLLSTREKKKLNKKNKKWRGARISFYCRIQNCYIFAYNFIV